MVPLSWIINTIYYVVPNYGVAIILFTIIIKAILFPFNLKGMKSSMRMQAVQPKMKELQEKYKDNKQKLAEEQQKLYKKENINPLAGCLPQIIPLIIMFGIYYVVAQPLTQILHLNDTQIQAEYYQPLVAKSVEMQTQDETSAGIKIIGGKSITSVINMSDLTGDQKTAIQNGTIGLIDLNDGKAIIDIGYSSFKSAYNIRQVDLMNLAAANGLDVPQLNFNFLGLNIGHAPLDMIGQHNYWYLIFPLLSGITAWGSQKIMMDGMKYMQQPDNKKKKSTAEQKVADMQGSMNSVMKIMPIFTAWIAFQFSAALGLYWIISNSTQLLQQWYINESIRKPHAEKVVSS